MNVISYRLMKFEHKYRFSTNTHTFTLAYRHTKRDRYMRLSRGTAITKILKKISLLRVFVDLLRTNQSNIVYDCLATRFRSIAI